MATLHDLKQAGMILCPFCGNGTPKKLKACKHCNHILPSRSMWPGFFAIIAIILMIKFHLVEAFYHALGQMLFR